MARGQALPATKQCFEAAALVLHTPAAADAADAVAPAGAAGSTAAHSRLPAASQSTRAGPRAKAAAACVRLTKTNGTGMLLLLLGAEVGAVGREVNTENEQCRQRRI